MSLVSCDNPADKTADANVKEAVAKTTDTAAGNFKLHGVEKNISFPATVSQDGETVKIAATFDIKRKDFGIVYPGRAEDLIRDEVIIRLDLVAKPEA